MPEEAAFEVFVSLLYGAGLRSLYMPDMYALQRALYVFSRLLHDRVPTVFVHFDQQAVEPFLFATSWFLTFFNTQFSFSFAEQVMGECASVRVCGCALHRKRRQRSRGRKTETETEVERGRERSRERGRDRERSRERSRERGRDRDRSRERSRERGREVETERERERDRERSRERERARQRQRRPSPHTHTHTHTLSLSHVCLHNADHLLVYGEPLLFRVALALLELTAADVCQCRTFEETLRWLQTQLPSFAARNAARVFAHARGMALGSSELASLMAEYDHMQSAHRGESKEVQALRRDNVFLRQHVNHAKAALQALRLERDLWRTRTVALQGYSDALVRTLQKHGIPVPLPSEEDVMACEDQDAFSIVPSSALEPSSSSAVSRATAMGSEADRAANESEGK